MDVIANESTAFKSDDLEFTETTIAKPPMFTDHVEPRAHPAVQPIDNHSSIPVSLYVKYLLDLDASYVTVDDRSTIVIQMSDKCRVYSEATRTSLAVSVITDVNLPANVKYDMLSQRNSLLSLVVAVRSEMSHNAMKRLLRRVGAIQQLVTENRRRVECTVSPPLASYLTHLLIQLIALKVYLKKRTLWLFGARKKATHKSRVWLKSQWLVIFRQCFLEECAAEDAVTSTTDAPCRETPAEMAFPKSCDNEPLGDEDVDVDDIIKLVPDVTSSTALERALEDESREHCSSYALPDETENTLAPGPKTDDGSKCFTLPITFFNNSKNIKLLSKCKPLCIKLIDYKRHSWYFKINNISSIAKALYPETNESDTHKVWHPSSTVINNPHMRNIFIHDANNACSNVYAPKNVQETSLKILPETVEGVDFKANKGLIGLKIVRLSEKSPDNVKNQYKQDEILDLDKEADNITTQCSPDKSKLMKPCLPGMQLKTDMKIKNNKKCISLNNKTSNTSTVYLKNTISNSPKKKITNEDVTKCSPVIDKVLSGLETKNKLNNKKLQNIKGALKLHSEEINLTQVKPFDDFNVDMPFNNGNAEKITLTYHVPKKTTKKLNLNQICIKKAENTSQFKNDAMSNIKQINTKLATTPSHRKNSSKTNKKEGIIKESVKSSKIANEKTQTKINIKQRSDNILKQILQIPSDKPTLHNDTPPISFGTKTKTAQQNVKMAESKGCTNILGDIYKPCELKVQTVSQINEGVLLDVTIDNPIVTDNEPSLPDNVLTNVNTIEIINIKSEIKEEPNQGEIEKALPADSCDNHNPTIAPQELQPIGNKVIVPNSAAQRYNNNVTVTVNSVPITNLRTAVAYQGTGSRPFQDTFSIPIQTLGTPNTNFDKRYCESIPPNSLALRQWRHYKPRSPSSQHFISGISGPTTPQTQWPYPNYNPQYNQMIWEQRNYGINANVYQNYPSNYYPGMMSSPMFRHALPPLSNLMQAPPPPPPPAPTAPPPPTSGINPYIIPNAGNGKKYKIVKVPPRQKGAVTILSKNPSWSNNNNSSKINCLKNYGGTGNNNMPSELANKNIKKSALVNPQNSELLIPTPEKHTTKGYSPPILPIPTVEKSLEIISLLKTIEKPVSLIKNLYTGKQSQPKCPSLQSPIKSIVKDSKTINDTSCNKRKITLEEYKHRDKRPRNCIDLTSDASDGEQKRAVKSNSNHENKCQDTTPLARKQASCKVSKDQGYDSDTTIKLDD